jgi:uncharacterized protein YodC (DUF2158 family)
MDGSIGGLSTEEIRILEELSSLKRLNNMTEQQQIAPGDVVRLKAGGIYMTVEATIADNARCVWFDDSKEVHSRDFKIAALEKR